MPYSYIDDGVPPGDFTEQFRYPIMRTAYPRWCYITAVVVDQNLWGGIRPTDDELRIVGSFHAQYVDYWYNAHWIERMKENPFDLDGSANGRYLIKRAEGDWAYRKASWIDSGIFRPYPRTEKQMDLLAVLDRIHSYGNGDVSPHWAAWKTEHPDVFAAVSS